MLWSSTLWLWLTVSLGPKNVYTWASSLHAEYATPEVSSVSPNTTFLASLQQALAELNQTSLVNVTTMPVEESTPPKYSNLLSIKYLPSIGNESSVPMNQTTDSAVPFKPIRWSRKKVITKARSLPLTMTATLPEDPQENEIVGEEQHLSADSMPANIVLTPPHITTKELVANDSTIFSRFKDYYNPLTSNQAAALAHQQQLNQLISYMKASDAQQLLKSPISGQMLDDELNTIKVNLLNSHRNHLIDNYLKKYVQTYEQQAATAAAIASVVNQHTKGGANKAALLQAPSPVYLPLASAPIETKVRPGGNFFTRITKMYTRPVRPMANFLSNVFNLGPSKAPASSYVNPATAAAAAGLLNSEPSSLATTSGRYSNKLAYGMRGNKLFSSDATSTSANSLASRWPLASMDTDPFGLSLPIIASPASSLMLHDSLSNLAEIRERHRNHRHMRIPGYILHAPTNFFDTSYIDSKEFSGDPLPIKSKPRKHHHHHHHHHDHDHDHDYDHDHPHVHMISKPNVYQGPHYTNNREPTDSADADTLDDSTDETTTNNDQKQSTQSQQPTSSLAANIASESEQFKVSRRPTKHYAMQNLYGNKSQELIDSLFYPLKLSKPKKTNKNSKKKASTAASDDDDDDIDQDYLDEEDVFESEESDDANNLKKPKKKVITRKIVRKYNHDNNNKKKEENEEDTYDLLSLDNTQSKALNESAGDHQPGGHYEVLASGKKEPESGYKIVEDKEVFSEEMSDDGDRPTNLTKWNNFENSKSETTLYGQRLNPRATKKLFRLVKKQRPQLSKSNEPYFADTSASMVSDNVIHFY